MTRPEEGKVFVVKRNPERLEVFFPKGENEKNVIVRFMSGYAGDPFTYCNHQPVCKALYEELISKSEQCTYEEASLRIDAFIKEHVPQTPTASFIRDLMTGSLD